jgi:Icc-related predicted phosphoesterase
MKNLTMKDVTINQAANQQYELLVNDKTIWVDGPEDIDEIAEVLEEMGIAFDKENADNINQAYFENEDAFDYYYLENKVGIETIKEKLEEEDWVWYELWFCILEKNKKFNKKEYD